MNIDDNDDKKGSPDEVVVTSVPIEVETYFGLMITVALIDNRFIKEASELSAALIKKLQGLNRRTLNPIAARIFFYFSRSYELANNLSEIRSVLLSAHRTARLRHDEETHIMLLNLLLRNYLHYNLYDQADKLQAKSSVKEDAVSSNQLARLRFYQGRIKAIQLDYTDSFTCLQEAIAKAPQNGARGFRQTVHKLSCIVQLLMGDIPERAIFRTKGLKGVLKPYLRLVQVVRVGDLVGFVDVAKNSGDIFRKDKNYTLIQRLRHNVIKTGLRKINIAYSRITLADISRKLQLDDTKDVEFIVAKAIRDGVVDATIDHDGGFICSKELIDVYSTQEPLEAFTARTNYCLKLHNDAVKAMRYPPKKKTEEQKEGDKEVDDKDVEDKKVEDKDKEASKDSAGDT
eukprot:TRINITY_DN4195_c0_g1_i2.p1 TRINITY_DN4195_c0_g1~~TRINITY_DN4195_c0_g1_i2.p1  ORF type:complete len:401 (+),score=80.97 TRINITY_DN4195_c0_g1_i2:349-1551(+)